MNFDIIVIARCQTCIVVVTVNITLCRSEVMKMGRLNVAEILYFEKSDSFKYDFKTERSWKLLSEIISKLVGSGYSELDNLATDYGVNMERQGFIEGFECAMRIFCTSNLDVIESEGNYDTSTGKQHGKQCVSYKAKQV